MRYTSPRTRQPGVQYEYVPLKGGLDQISPTLAVAAGVIRDSVNFEVTPSSAGGYSRITGYERYDGRAAPSSATYSLIQVTTFATVPTVGQTLTGNTSGATGVIIALGANYLAITKVVGTFTSTEVVKVGVVTIGTAVTLTTVLNAKTDAIYSQLAADNYRADIGPVPGSGPVRGVVSAIVSAVDQVYAFRDNAGATKQELYKATTSGWTLIPFYNEVAFTAGGIIAPADGTTLTQGANTAVIKRVVLESGSWAGGTAAGRFIVTTPAPGNFANGAATIGPVGVTLTAIQRAITLTVGGRYEFDIGNFSGQSTTIRIYGCDGVNPGFEFDGDVYVPIRTGMTVDAPTHVKIHKQQLFFSFLSSAVHSAPGFPYKWASVDGASEIAVGDTITNFLTQPGANNSSAVGITTTSNTLILYGSSAANWNLVPFNTGVGGTAFTARLLNQSYWLDDPGVVNMTTTYNFGNFTQSTITTNIPTLIADQQARPVYAMISRTRSQYRLLYNDGVGIYITIVNGKVLGMAKVQYTDPMHCAWNGASASSEERGFCGGVSSGYVYQMDKGPSFDGAIIDAYLTLNWDAMRTPRMVKRYRRASLEMSGSFYAAISFGYALGYNSTGLIQPQTKDYESGFSGQSNWDNVAWDAFTWDGSTLFPTEVQLRGSAVNLQPSIRCGTNYIQPFTISSIMYHYSTRRGVR